MCSIIMYSELATRYTNNNSSSQMFNTNVYNLFLIFFWIICRKGSLNVDYEVYTAMNSQVVADVTFLSKDMVTGKSKVTYEGHEVTVSSVTLVDTSGNSRKITFNILDKFSRKAKPQKLSCKSVCGYWWQKDCAVYFW